MARGHESTWGLGLKSWGWVRVGGSGVGAGVEGVGIGVKRVVVFASSQPRQVCLRQIVCIKLSCTHLDNWYNTGMIIT